MYAYVGNDPVNYYDPEGEAAVIVGIYLAGRCSASIACRGVVGGTLGAIFGAASNAYSELSDDESGFNGARFLSNTAIDTAAGSAMAINPTKATVIAATAGAAKRLVAAGISGDISEDTVVDMIDGAASEAIGAKFGGLVGGGKPFPFDEGIGAIAGTAGAGAVEGALPEVSEDFKDQPFWLPPPTGGCRSDGSLNCDQDY